MKAILALPFRRTHQKRAGQPPSQDSLSTELACGFSVSPLVSVPQLQKLSLSAKPVKSVKVSSFLEFAVRGASVWLGS